MRHYQFNRCPVIDTTVALSHLFLNYVFLVHDTYTTARQKNPYKSLVCLNNRSLNTRYALHIFYESRDPTLMQFKQQSTDLIFIITIRETTDMFVMIVAVI